MRSCFRSIVLLILLFSSLSNVVNAQEEIYLCIWRNPERTMTRLFPEAYDYKTISRNINKEELLKIEKELGFELLPGQREQFQYYEIYAKDSTLLGYVFASSQKGTYGAIEFVFGINSENRSIMDIYIQRSREREKQFKTREFLDIFRGKIHSEITFSITEGIADSIPKSSIISGILKELTVFYLIGDGVLPVIPK